MNSVLVKAVLRCSLILLLALCASTCIAAVPYRLEVLATGLDQPWSLAFLPDGTALVTELPGSLRHIAANGEVGAPVQNVPPVYLAGQGGLFDVALHPDFVHNQLVYLAYAAGTPDSNATTIARGRLQGNRLENVEVIYHVTPPKNTPVHYGGRIAFLPDGTLLLTTGDGFNFREAAQDIGSGLGKVMRMNDDGSPAAGNPFPEAPYVYTYGHRNPQGLAVGKDGAIWLHEHGPRGGDEVNRLEAGRNYGWPAITFGIDYSGATISPYTAWPGMEQPKHYWVPSIAPSGLAVYQGRLFPQWQGDLFVGALADQEVRRLDIEGDEVVGEEALFNELDARVRDVRNGPDGALYILTNGSPGQLIRVVPAGPGVER